jgi:hypothetical protein
LIEKKYLGIIIGIVLIAALIISVITLSSHITTPKNKTFSNGGITFQYPNTWSSNKTFRFSNTTSGDPEVLGTIGDDKVSMAILATNLSKNPELKKFNLSTLVKLNYKLEEPDKKLSLNETRINNFEAYEEIYLSTDPVNNINEKNVGLLIGTKDMWYSIIFRTSESNFDTLYPQFKEIISSIKIQ